MTHQIFENKKTLEKRPEWLKVRPPQGKTYHKIRNMLQELKLVTVCQEALCPNIEKCWNGGTATFMLMGDTCTRACRFCAVKTGNPQGFLDSKEAFKISQAVSLMGLSYVVLTSVDRDDLSDLGSGHFAYTITTLKQKYPSLIIECLTPDFNAQTQLIKKVTNAGPHVFAHNLETVRRLTPRVRDRRSSYEQSLETLRIAKEAKPQLYTKTSLMLGLGERDEEVQQALLDLKKAGCDVVTFGQYLAPTNRHKKYLPVIEYVHPRKFQHWKKICEEMNFLYSASGPLVRSSYRAAEYFLQGVISNQAKLPDLNGQERRV